MQNSKDKIIKLIERYGLVKVVVTRATVACDCFQTWTSVARVKAPAIICALTLTGRTSASVTSDIGCCPTAETASKAYSSLTHSFHFAHQSQFTRAGTD